MTTGFQDSSGTDTDSLFTPGNSGLDTGFKRSDGVDLGLLYHPYTTGAKRAATGLQRSDGVDLSDLFQNSSVPLFTWTAVNEYSEGAGSYDPPFTNIGGNAGVRYNTDGTTTLTSNYGPSAGTNWGSGGAFTDKYVRCRSYVGDAPQGQAVGTWLQITSNRNWYIQTINGTSTKSTTLTIDFSTDGSTIHHTVTVDLVVGIA